MLRDFKSPKTTRGGEFCKLKVILIRNYRDVIKSSVYNPNQENEDYYKAYEEAIKKEHNATTIHQLEYQETFIRNLIGVEVVYLTCFLLLIVCHGKCFFLCALAMSLVLMVHPLLFGAVFVLMTSCISLPHIYQNIVLSANNGIPLDYVLFAFIIALTALCITCMAHYFAQLKVYRKVWELGLTNDNNEMKVILLKGPENSGKSTTLMLLVKQLIDNGYEIIQRNEVGGFEYDVSILLKKKNEEFTVMIHCATDDQERIEELERFLKYTQKVDLLVAACRDKNKALDKMRELFKDSEISPMEDGANVAQKMSAELFDKIEKLLERK